MNKRRRIQNKSRFKRIKNKARCQIIEKHKMTHCFEDDKTGNEISNPNFPESEGIQNDGNRTACHGQSANGWIEMPTEPWIEEPGGNWNTDNIITKCPKKILADDFHNGPAQGNCRGNFAEIMSDQNDPCGFHGDIRSGSDGNTDICDC